MSSHILETGRAALPAKSADSLEKLGGVVETSQMLEGRSNFPLSFPVSGRSSFYISQEIFMGRNEGPLRVLAGELSLMTEKAHRPLPVAWHKIETIVENLKMCFLHWAFINDEIQCT